MFLCSAIILLSPLPGGARGRFRPRDRPGCGGADVRPGSRLLPPKRSGDAEEGLPRLRDRPIASCPYGLIPTPAIRSSVWS